MSALQVLQQVRALDIKLCGRDGRLHYEGPTGRITPQLLKALAAHKAAILDLKAELAALEGSRFDERRFHEEFLLQGSIPPGLFREQLLAAARLRAKDQAASAPHAAAKAE